MEQPPLIDVETEHGGKSRLMGVAGCLGKMIPVAVGLMVLLLVVMGLAYFVWGGDIEKKEEKGAAGTESVEKKGFAGVIEKVKRVVKGEKKKPEVADKEGTVSGEGGAEGGDGFAGAAGKSAALAESVGAEAKSPQERDQLLKEKYRHLEQDRAQGQGDGAVSGAAAAQAGGGSPSGAGGPDDMDAARNALRAGAGGSDIPAFEDGANGSSQAAAAGQAAAGETQNAGKRRGGSFGSSTGAAKKTGVASQYHRWRGDFKTSGSDLEFEVIYQETGGQLQFRCFVMPYDSQTARLFRADKGDFLLSFRDKSGKRLVPKTDDLAIPLTKMTAFESRGKVMGWVARGAIPLEKQKLSELKSVKLGWDFDKELGDWLKALKKTRGE